MNPRLRLNIGNLLINSASIYEQKTYESLSSIWFVSKIFFKQGEKPVLRKISQNTQDSPRHRDKGSPGN